MAVASSGLVYSFAYLKQTTPKITEQVEEVEGEPAETIEDGYGHQHQGGASCPLHVFCCPVVPDDAVLLQVKVEPGVNNGDYHGG